MKFIKDSEFIRGKCPMTKEDIRILTISKLDLDKDSNFLDIGSGTGSITIQASKFIEEGSVFSIERDEEAIRVTKENLKKFNCNNVTLLEGDAIEHMESLSKEIKKEKIRIIETNILIYFFQLLLLQWFFYLFSDFF